MKDTIEFFNLHRRGFFDKPPSGWQPGLPLPNRPQTQADHDTLAFLRGFLEKIARDETIEGEDWTVVSHLAAGIIFERRLFLGDKHPFLDFTPGKFKASEMQFRIKDDVYNFSPPQNSRGKCTFPEQARLSDEFRLYAAIQAFEILMIVEATPKEGRSLIGLCENCGDFFEMSTKGKKQRFCSGKCKSLYRSVKPLATPDEEER